MTWNEVRLATLQKMFSGEGTAIRESDETIQEYLASMPQAANEAAALLCAAGFGLRQTCRLEEAAGAVDLQTALPQWYPGDALELYRTGQDGTLMPVSGARMAAGHILMPPAGKGELLAVYTARPVPITPDTPLEAPMELQPEAAVLMPLYMASQLYKDDDITIATQYRNEFEAAVEQLQRGCAGVQGGGFAGVSGWV